MRHILFGPEKKLNQIINDSVSVPSLIWQRGAVPVLSLYMCIFLHDKDKIKVICARYANIANEFGHGGTLFMVVALC